jgi:HEAT repeat protein
METAREGNADARFWAYRALARIQSEYAATFLLQQLEGGEKTNKNFAAISLQDAEDPRVIPALVRALNDDSWSVCSAAARSLTHKGEMIIDELVDSLKTANYNVAFWITKILSRVGKNGVKTLKKFLRFKNKNVRILVTEALADSKDITVVPDLVDCLRDESWSVQNNAADALANLGEDVVEPLMVMIKDEPEIYNWIIVVLDKLGKKQIRPLCKLLRHPDRDVRMRAAEALGSTQSESAIKPLIEALNDKVWLVRKSAAKGLASIGEIAVDPLIRNLKTEDENVRYWITTILGKIGDKTIDSLVRILQTGTKDMKCLAGQALGETRDERAVRPLIESLKDEEWTVRSSSATALKQLGSVTVFPLIKVLMDQNEDLRYWSKKIVADIGPMEVDQFIKILQFDENPEMRYFAAYGLSIIRSTKAIEPLISALLNDTDDWVRRYSSTALGAIGEPRVVKPLMVALGGENQELSMWIAKVLGSMGSVAVEPLTAAVESKDEKMQLYAMIALAEIGEVESVKALIGFLDNEGEIADHVIRVLSNSGSVTIPFMVEALQSKKSNIRNNAYNVLVKMVNERDEIQALHDKELNEELKHWLAKVLRNMSKTKLRLKL